MLDGARAPTTRLAVHTRRASGGDVEVEMGGGGDGGRVAVLVAALLLIPLLLVVVAAGHPVGA